MSVAREGAVAVITWDDGENRINRDSLGWLHAILDELEGSPGPLAIVWTGVGKFFSNGLDLARFGADPEELGATLRELHRSVARLLLFPSYSVAALNGHTFAGGALLSCAVDYRVMREDRGFWCMNEADIGFALDAKLAAILFNRLPRATAIEAMITARRYGAADARAAGIVQESATEDQLVARAVEVAGAMAGKDRVTLAAHKRVAYGEVATFLGFPEGR
jgi:enoyl-CoA hydratase/carnithine racemase